MRYYLIAGEASGDLHGSNLIRELKKLDVSADFRCWGGDLMQAAGGTLVKHYRDLAFMGFIEVIANLRTIMRNLRFCRKDILTFSPDVLILIDYPGFNLRIAEWAHQQQIKTVFYISPQVWAWKENRVQQIKKFVNKMLVILPFEEAFYKKWNYEVEYVGHPLVEVVDQAVASEPAVPAISVSPLNDPHIVALLPGSRRQEISRKLPIMLEVSKLFPRHTFVVARAASLEDSFYDNLMQSYPKVRSVRNKTYELLMNAKAALVTSGTATLETALFGVPEVVCYKGSNISYQIAKRLIRIKYISLVNLIMNKEVVKELIQNDMNVKQVHAALDQILHDQRVREKMLLDFRHLKDILRKGGNASANAAASIYRYTKKISAEKTAAAQG